ncbi:MAG: 2-amino-4-hydroxy-6-hydroxymethyldihydropteridine diphosphokinase [Xanthomonadaceae bacterium]|nr:2-amino-4-hydroxy-6-hydroxymethyldihydropteridine diphosphokinase [Xanthomonadaceae bacterium]MDE1958096.1 2-amino-4-hydroxy-6-hydroxymethyldihydropteridine diphosphokinase [Xanthomonadaceae bacterium]MDE2177534.1 2-amino-4-hydroxy-6-hydroxymethyldihydropteridine diphosphokinase [Xanthomonadaceae bacterium]MDE2244669.1 2-amino-4-hydroxy-6-hydroxymethyldihydropteridine diphosphokinase [Xanthomonadaceae bacterium]
MIPAWVGLGANCGDPGAQIVHACVALARLPQTRLLARSRLWHTPPWGPVPQADFLNAAVALDTLLAPRALLEALLAIEREAGRDRAREQRWGPRRLDLDLLLYGQQRLEAPGLSVPHPRLAERAFVLLPLADIDPALVVPGAGVVAELLARVDRTGCEPWVAPA